MATVAFTCRSRPRRCRCGWWCPEEDKPQMTDVLPLHTPTVTHVVEVREVDDHRRRQQHRRRFDGHRHHLGVDHCVVSVGDQNASEDERAASSRPNPGPAPPNRGVSAAAARNHEPKHFLLKPVVPAGLPWRLWTRSGCQRRRLNKALGIVHVCPPTLTKSFRTSFIYALKTN